MSTFGQLFKMTSVFRQRHDDGVPFRMRCLPYFYIIGPQKTGTTDLFRSLVAHPNIAQGYAKEPHWWTRSRLSKCFVVKATDMH